MTYYTKVYRNSTIKFSTNGYGSISDIARIFNVNPRLWLSLTIEDNFIGKRGKDSLLTYLEKNNKLYYAKGDIFTTNEYLYEFFYWCRYGYVDYVDLLDEKKLLIYIDDENEGIKLVYTDEENIDVTRREKHKNPFIVLADQVSKLFRKNYVELLFKIKEEEIAETEFWFKLSGKLMTLINFHLINLKFDSLNSFSDPKKMDNS